MHTGLAPMKMPVLHLWNRFGMPNPWTHWLQWSSLAQAVSRFRCCKMLMSSADLHVRRHPVAFSSSSSLVEFHGCLLWSLMVRMPCWYPTWWLRLVSGKPRSSQYAVSWESWVCLAPCQPRVYPSWGFVHVPRLGNVGVRSGQQEAWAKDICQDLMDFLNLSRQLSSSH